ncbi:MAG TPA: hypothetical protein VJ779_16650, partial [Acetobacteraceae bacterium]|nr:hypothetical protein [Acetobacteraceae bacterium]
MSEIQDFAGSTAGFYRKTAVEQLLMLAWFVEARQQRTCFDGAYMRQCFREVGVDAPDMSVYLPRLASKKPAQLIKGQGGYRLSGVVRRDLDRRLGGDPAMATISHILSDLPSKVPDVAERAFLSEALNCYRVKAYRAAMIMVWNLAYDHLVRWAFADAGRLQSLNSGIATKYPKKSLVLAKLDDLDDLKESELIEAARTGRLLDKNTTQILKDKLARRNSVA